jgi:hypothetical protein
VPGHELRIEICAVFRTNDRRLSEKVLYLGCYFTEFDVFYEWSYASVSANDILCILAPKREVG